MTELVAHTFEQQLSAQVAEFAKVEETIADLESRHSGLAITDIANADEVKRVTAAHIETKKTRVGIETQRKALKQPALEYGKKLDAAAKRYDARIRKLEDALDSEREKIRVEERRQKEAEEQAAQDKLAARVAAMQAVNAVIRLDMLTAITDAQFDVELRLATESNKERIAEAERAEELRLDELERQRKEQEQRDEEQRVERERLQKIANDQAAELARVQQDVDKYKKALAAVDGAPNDEVQAAIGDVFSHILKQSTPCPPHELDLSGLELPLPEREKDTDAQLVCKLHTFADQWLDARQKNDAPSASMHVMQLQLIVEQMEE